MSAEAVDLKAIIETINDCKTRSTLPRFSEDSELQSRDFVAVLPSITSALNIILGQELNILTSNLVDSLDEREAQQVYSLILAPAICIAVAHVKDDCFTDVKLPTNPWITEENAAISGNILCLSRAIARKLKPEGEYNQSECLYTLFEEKSDLPRYLLNHMRPRLQKSNWKNDPSARFVLHWIVYHIDLDKYLDEVLPPVLLLVDDYKSENKLLGIRCLKTMFSIERSEQTVRAYNKPAVVLDALLPLMNIHEPEIVLELYDLLQCVLRYTDPDQPRNMYPVRRSVADSIAANLIGAAFMQSQADVRQAYAKAMDAYFRSWGVECVRNFKMLFDVWEDYLTWDNGRNNQTICSVLQTVQFIYVHSFPRMKLHTERIYSIVVRLLIDVNLSGERDTLAVRGMARLVLNTMRRHNSGFFDTLTLSVCGHESLLPPDVRALLLDCIPNEKDKLDSQIIVPNSSQT